MHKVTIDGIDAYDGEYELDIEQLTNGDLHTIKQLTGLRGGEIDDAIDAMDNDVVVGLAAVAIKRSGKPLVPQLLWDAKVGAIQIKDPEPAEAVATEEATLPPPEGA